MKKLLSLPPNLVDCFHDITGASHEEWFCSCDPIGKKLGSGGGTAWLLWQAFMNDNDSGNGEITPELKKQFCSWLKQEKRILLHAGGQSRRLPAYAPSGKILTPIPVFRWERGQKLSQDLLSLQVPLYQQIMEQAPDDIHTMVVSGDVYIRTTEPLQSVPGADVVCYGLWLGPETAKNHGVFVSDRKNPSVLKCMLQKPSVDVLADLQHDHYYLTDIGIWLLSDRAVEVLMRKCGSDFSQYDLYSEFGCALGTDPSMPDPEVGNLSVAVCPLAGGEFYHFGTTHDILSSTLAIQNRVNDQRFIMHHDRKPHPSMFVQNAETWVKLSEENKNVWIENSCVSEGWKLSHEHVITGVPQNDWKIELLPGQCVDIVPIGESAWAVRPYGYHDTFRGQLMDRATTFLGQVFVDWASRRTIDISQIEGNDDIQQARIFPVVEDISDIGLVLRWMLNEPQQQGGKMLWKESRKVSAEEISTAANLQRLVRQRRGYRSVNWSFLAKNYQHSVFYQVDLEDAAREFADNNIALPHPLPDSAPLMTKIHDAMFRSEVQRLRGKDYIDESDKAFGLMRDAFITDMSHTANPRLSVSEDQIVWGRSPVRIDIAGGWTDTPPFCLMEGGSVINFAIELNGQPPLQVFLKPCKERHIILRSIDMGRTEVVTTAQQLSDYNQVGSPFSIPKAALVLAGLTGDLQERLEDFGSGIELTLLSAIPAGSGLGTSSLLASTVLGTLSDFCGLGWDRAEIGRRTLVLEQLLTTGGGWQDQFGGIFQGIKLLQTDDGFNQTPVVRWLPTELFTQPDARSCHLLYYTGITRTAKTILSEIVRRMFLNHGDELRLLREMKAHTLEMYEAIQRNRFEEMGRLVRKTWQQNQLLDSGTNPSEIQALTSLIDDLCLGYKLPGAGGGGYLYMIAKDTEAAARIRTILTNHARHANARFVDMTLSTSGLQVSRS